MSMNGTLINMGWTEITLENEEQLYKAAEDPSLEIIIEQDGYYSLLRDISPTIHTMAKRGGYYYIALKKRNYQSDIKD